MVPTVQGRGSPKLCALLAEAGEAARWLPSGWAPLRAWFTCSPSSSAWPLDRWGRWHPPRSPAHRGHTHCPCAFLTELPTVLPWLLRVSLVAGVPEVVGRGHVLEAVVRRRAGVQPVAGAVVRGRAQGAWPLAEVVGVQRVLV